MSECCKIEKPTCVPPHGLRKMKSSLIVIGVIVGALFCGSAVSFARQRSIWRFVQLLGAVFLVVVVLTHFAEALSSFPGMGWGLPNSAGHYLDLVSAVLGLLCLSIGYIASVLSRREKST